MWGKSLSIVRVGGVAFKFDASWLLIASLVVWSLATSYFPARLPDAQSSTNLVLAFAGLTGFFASILLHELAHVIVARGEGVRASWVDIYPFGGVSDSKAALPPPLTEILIAVAGPTASVGLAFLAWLGAGMAEIGGTWEYGASVLSCFAFINLILGIGNLIPAFPLDGGRILRAVLWLRSGDLVDATVRATRFSIWFSFLLVGLGLLLAFSGDIVGGLWPVVIGLFLNSAARKSCIGVQQTAALDGRTVAELMSHDLFTARPDQSLSELVSKVFLEHGVSFVPVVEEGVILGYIDTHLVRRIDRENWTTTVVDDVLESISDENSVAPDMPGRDLADRINQTGRRKFMVVVGTTIVGVVTLSDLVSFLRVAREFQ